MIEFRNYYTEGGVDAFMLVADNIIQSDNGKFWMALPESENLARLMNESLWRNS